MKPPDETDARNTVSIVLDIAVNLLYLAGIAAIDLVLRPLLGAKGVPHLVDSTLIAGELALSFALARRLVMALDNLVRTIRETYTAEPPSESWRQIIQAIQSRSSPALTESPTAEEPEGASHIQEADEVSAKEEPGRSPATEADDVNQSDRKA